MADKETKPKKKVSAQAKGRSLSGSYTVAKQKKIRIQNELAKYVNSEGGSVSSQARLGQRTEKGQNLTSSLNKARDELNKITSKIVKNRKSKK